MINYPSSVKYINLSYFYPFFLGTHLHNSLNEFILPIIKFPNNFSGPIALKNYSLVILKVYIKLEFIFFFFNKNNLLIIQKIHKKNFFFIILISILIIFTSLICSNTDGE